jgi:phosphonate transport system permease protein
MLGGLFAEVIEDMDVGPVEALTMTGASRLQIFSHAVVP